ncbi:succinate-semialdehyde dehydrogenase [Deltaproteobacteria bacterium]|nr:succinate-semialdehyde dehydrogenase [Deltaproteobacteria bacterium]
MSQKTELTPAEKETQTKKFRDYINEKVANAKTALAELDAYTQEQVDALAKACARTIFDNAEELARDAVAETQLGTVEFKTMKNRNKAKIIWWSLKGKKSVGIIERDEEAGLVKVAKPVGVVGAITPMTNPIVTVMSNAMFAIKGRNPIIFSVHPKALECSKKTVRYLQAALEKLNAPKNTIQLLEIPSIELTQMLASSVDVIIATGGMDMVRAVYSSGKPALGMGAGNVQVLVDTDVDYATVVPKIVTGRAFDNGIVCTSEQSAVLPRCDWDAILKLFPANKAFVVPASQRDALRDASFPGGKMNRDLVGKNAIEVAKAAGINVPADTSILVVEATGRDDVLGSEKMFPVLSVYPYDTWEEAVEIARNNLNKIGKGHSIAVHSNNREHVEYAGIKTEVSRIVVNQQCASTGGGSFQNGLSPTNTLGCGSWGNNSISENLTYYHLINISRIAYFQDKKKVPSDEEIWA